MEVTNAKNTINNFKRLIGRRFQDSHVQQEKEFNAYAIVEGPNSSVNIEVCVFHRIVIKYQSLHVSRLIISMNVNVLHRNKSLELCLQN